MAESWEGKKTEKTGSNFVHVVSVMGYFIAHYLARLVNASRLNFASICRIHRAR